jgi:putative transcriptional regulator
MMCAHDADHAMGVVINKPKEDLTLSAVLGHLGLEGGRSEPPSSRIVLDGGPVRPDRGYVLHSEDFAAGDATQSGGAGRAADGDARRAGGCGGRSRAGALSCWRSAARAGAQGQLEGELKHNAWLVVDYNDAIVFDATARR